MCQSADPLLRQLFCCMLINRCLKTSHCVQNQAVLRETRTPGWIYGGGSHNRCGFQMVHYGRMLISGIIIVYLLMITQSTKGISSACFAVQRVAQHLHLKTMADMDIRPCTESVTVCLHTNMPGEYKATSLK